MPYVQVDVDLFEIDTDDLISEVVNRITSERVSKKPTEREIAKLKEAFGEIVKAIGLSPMKEIDIKTLDDKMKYEHILKVWGKYTSEQMERMMPE